MADSSSYRLVSESWLGHAWTNYKTDSYLASVSRLHDVTIEHSNQICFLSQSTAQGKSSNTMAPKIAVILGAGPGAGAGIA